MNISKEIAYALGFYWADGSLCRNQKQLNLYIKTSDFNEIKEVLNKLIPFKKVYTRSPKIITHSPQSGFVLSHKQTYNFLYENEYHLKSTVSPYKILKLIPKELQCYFIRGFFDGDGNILSRNRSNVFSFTGSYEQDWTSFIDIFKSLNMNVNVYKYHSDRSSFSRISIYNIKNCLTFFNYIYPNNKYDFGLKRKFNLLNDIKNKLTNEHIKKVKESRQTIIKYIFLNCETNKKFSIIGEKNVYNFFKEKNKIMEYKNRFCGQKIIDAENTKQNNIIFIKKIRIKKQEIT